MLRSHQTKANTNVIFIWSLTSENSTTHLLVMSLSRSFLLSANEPLRIFTLCDNFTIKIPTSLFRRLVSIVSEKTMAQFSYGAIGITGCERNITDQTWIQNVEKLILFFCRGMNAMHVLGQYGRENAGALFDLFMECMPEYPIDKPDQNGNTGTIFLTQCIQLSS